MKVSEQLGDIIQFISDADKSYKEELEIINFFIDKIIKVATSLDSRPPNYQDKNEFCKEYWEEVKILINIYYNEKINNATI